MGTGLILSLTAVILWGVLAIPLKLSVEFIDATTLTWTRFTFAFLFTLIIQASFGRLKQFLTLEVKDFVRLGLAGIFLTGNYVTFVWCLEYIAPGTAQLNFQVAPFYLAIGGILFFKEPVNAKKWVCFGALACGMLMFFHPSLNTSASDAAILTGVMIVQFSTISWSIYALIQKSMGSKLSPANSLMFIYFLGILILLPWSHSSILGTLNAEQYGIVLFCCCNTLIAYGAFAMALKRWKTIQVSAMLGLTPIVTFMSTAVCVLFQWWPDHIVSDNLEPLSFAGIVLVVASVAGVQFMSAGKTVFKKKRLSPD